MRRRNLLLWTFVLFSGYRVMAAGVGVAAGIAPGRNRLLTEWLVFHPVAFAYIGPGFSNGIDFVATYRDHTTQAASFDYATTQRLVTSQLYDSDVYFHAIFWPHQVGFNRTADVAQAIFEHGLCNGGPLAQALQLRSDPATVTMRVTDVVTGRIDPAREIVIDCTRMGGTR